MGTADLVRAERPHVSLETVRRRSATAWLRAAGAVLIVLACASTVDAQTFLYNLATGGQSSGQVEGPLGIAIDRDGFVYVTEGPRNSRISKFDRDGTFVSVSGYGVLSSRAVPETCGGANFCRAGIAGDADGQFTFPGLLSIDGAGNLVVPDTGGQSVAPDRVQIISPSGAFIRKFGTRGSAAGQLLTVNSTAVDAAGNIYAADAQHGVQKFDINGNFLGALGSRGSGAGQYGSVGDVKLDGNGNIYVTDTRNSRVLKFDPDGAFLFAWGFGVRDGAAVPQVCRETCRAGVAGPADGQFTQPYGLTTDTRGRVYVSDLTNIVSASNHRVQVFDSEGNFLARFGTRGTSDGQFAYPVGMAVDAAGLVYVADNFNNRVPVFRVDVDGDGLIGNQDADNDRDGILDVDERRARPALAAAASEDSDLDGDGIPNQNDLDSDGDGIADVVEAGGVDADGDGLVDDPSDANGDGLADAVDSAQGGRSLPLPDTDDDGTPDFLDADADGDGITDATEAGGRDDNANGILDENEDLDRDGLADGVQASVGGVPLPLPDSDDDGKPDYLDDTSSSGGGGGGGGCAVGRGQISPAAIALYLIAATLIATRRRARR
jgi:sugar lactone lactonase YvrE